MRCIVKYKLYHEPYVSILEFTRDVIDAEQVIAELTTSLRPEVIFEYPAPKNASATEAELSYERLKNAVDSIHSEYGVQSWSYQLFQ